MDTVAPTVTLHLSTGQFPQAMANLVTWCVQKSYAFLQTCHHVAHTEVEILNQQHQLLVRLMLHVIPPETPAHEATSLASGGTLSADSNPLVQNLIRLCTSA